ncbi:MFS transporter [Periweissella cryptocerci]|uniref:MFS transporter n=1 Tax=Periweissella cryptocerci TaxID=2506420 RepID=A0A4P6YTW3_9LACO|nr:MFS transporter [Periweissella cryptocerci]QBO36150.1 MFS transporter [Periweissella cryptocerci]
MNEFLHNKLFRSVAASAYVNQLGTSLYNLVFIIYASTLPYKTLAVSLATVVTTIPTVFQMFTGYWADKSKNKIRATLRTRLIQIVLFGMLTYFVQDKQVLTIFIVLLVINLASDLLGEYSNGAELTILKHIVPEEKLNEALSISTAFAQLIMIVGQAAGVALLTLVKYNFSIIAAVNVFTFVISFMLILVKYRGLNEAVPVGTDTTENSEEREVDVGFVKNVKRMIADLRNSNGLLQLIFWFFLVNNILTVTEAVSAIGLLHSPTLWISSYSTTMALFGVTTSVGTIFGSIIRKDPLMKKSFATVTNVLLAFVMIVVVNFVVVKSVIVFFAGMFFIGYVFGKLGPRFSAMLMKNSNPKRMAITAGTVNTLIVIGGPVSQIIFLGIANLVSVQVTWITLAIVIVITVIVVLYSNAKLKTVEN